MELSAIALVDGYAAVQRARGWVNVGAQVQRDFSPPPGSAVDIPDGNAAAVMPGCQAGLTGAAQVEGAMTQTMRYYDGQRWREVWVNEHEMAEFVRPGPEGRSRSAAPAAAATLLLEGRGVRFWRLDPQGAGAVTLSRSVAPARHYSPVFHLSASGGPRLALSGNIVVRFRPEWSETQIQAWLTAQGLVRLRVLSGVPSPTYLLSVGSGLDALERANAIQERGEVEYAMPEWWREVNKR